nr:protein FAR1-RELATED SEQUENCE 5-like [Ipomoea trifida]
MDNIEQDNSAIVMGDEFEGFSEHTMVGASTEKNEKDGQDTNGHVFEDEVCEGGNDEWISECDESIRPYIGQRFSTVEECVQFYKSYATMVGFDVR